MIGLSLAEVRRLLSLADDEEERWRLGLWWSRFRRQHQAGAQRCHRARRAGAVAADGTDGLAVVLRSGAVDLTDERWARVVAVLGEERPSVGRAPREHRELLDAILWVMRAGSRWEDLPERFGSWRTAYSRYVRWRAAGRWDQFLAALHADAGTPS
jgi:hypothetical protein